MRRAIRLVLYCFSCLLLSGVLAAQAVPAQSSAAQTAASLAEKPAIDFAAILTREFGPDFTLVKKYPPMLADLDHDGREDLVLIANCSTNPLGLSEKMHYAVQDPYGKYFGYSNAGMSLGYGSIDPKFVPIYLLIVHNWRGTPVGSKYVLINIPFERIKLGYSLLKKKTIEVIETEDEIGVQAAVYWDGKRYRWEATAMNQMK